MQIKVLALSTPNNTARLFCYSAGGLLFATAVAKFVSAMGTAQVLLSHDPLFNVPFRFVFLAVGGIETAIAFTCWFSKKPVVQAGLVAWLASSFVIYRLGLLIVGYREPCHCLGSLTDALHISPHTADAAMKIILSYLLIGSYGSLFWLWRQNRNVAASVQPQG